jgi:hypothetical protein
MTTVTTKVTAFEVSAYPDDIEGHAFALKVEYRGPDRWAILRHGSCYNFITGDWDYESLPSNRRDKWLDEHRRPMDEAIRMAEILAPNLTVNGWTITQARRMAQGENLCGGLVMQGVRCSKKPSHNGGHAR